MTNTQRQPRTLSTITPPRIGPARNAMVVPAVHWPIALDRATPEKFDVMSASELGTRSAPAMPWMPRATMSNSGLTDTAQSSDATPNPTSPIRRITIRPSTSDSDPANRMSDPSVIRYASTTHCCVVSPPPSSRAIAGSATLMTLPSRNDTNDARIATQMTSRWFRVRVTLAIDPVNTQPTTGVRVRPSTLARPLPRPSQAGRADQESESAHARAVRCSSHPRAHCHSG